jgi:cytochrome c-type biogenesis protein
MESLVPGIWMALWFGILTSISPCPLATNIVAVSYVGKQLSTKRGVLLSGLSYTSGRMLTYAVLGSVLISSTQSIYLVANFLQQYMNILLGPLLLFIGFILLDKIRFNFDGGIGSLINRLQGRIAGTGLMGAFLLGILFALSFCPVSAGLFFGSLFSLSIKYESGIIMPLIFGLGTALPVLGLAIIMGISASLAASAVNKLASFEIWARRITAVIFLAAGLYYCVNYLPDLVG